MAVHDQMQWAAFDARDLLRRFEAVGRALGEARDAAEIFRTLREFVADVVSFDVFLVSLRDAEGRALRCMYCWADGAESDPSRLGPLRLETGEAVVCHDPPAEASPPSGPARQTRSHLTLPMATGGRVIGSVQLRSYEAARYVPADAIPVAAVANHAAAALENARLVAEADEVRRLAERDREAWARTFEAMADAVVLVDAEDRVVRANPSFWALTRRGPDLLGRPLARELHHDENEVRACQVCAARVAGREGTFMVMLPSAESPLGRHFEVKVNRVVDADGGFAGMVQVLRDVTALRTAEAELSSRQAILDSVLSSTADIISLLDLSGRVVWVNPAVERFGGHTPESLRGRSILEFFDGGARSLVETLLERVRAGQTGQFEHGFARPDGSILLLEIVLSPVVELGRTTGIVGTARDITERRASMERASEGEKLRALGQLAAGVAHDFNNLLASILGYAQLLGRVPGLQEPSVARKLAAIEQAARDGAETVRRIQNFTREQPDRSSERIRVDELLRQAADLARPRWKDQAQATGRLIRVEIEPVPPSLTVDGSGAELREVVTNLLFNAVEAMPEGGVITLSAEVEDGWVLLRVRDTGHGMSGETRRRVFEPFFTTRGPQNSGLGLAVSYGIVRRHGGAIEVESEPNVATVFTVRLPGPGAGTLAEPRAPRPAPGRLDASVLVVEDEDMVRDVVADALRSAGAEVTAVGSGREALAALTRSHFGVVVTDLGMPDVNGWDVARAAAAVRPRPRVLLLTGWGTGAAPDARVPGEPDLVERVLAKPIDIDDLVAAVRGST